MSDTNSLETALTAASPVTSKSLARTGNTMDFTPVSYSAPERRKTRRIVAGVISLGAGLAIVPTTLAVLDGVLSNSEAVFPGLGVPTLLFTAIVSSAVPEIRRDTSNGERKEALRTSFNERYGLRMSREEFDALSYPDVQPTSSFEVFGSMIHRERVSESSFVESKIYLVWMDGRFQLSKSKDGKNFKELKPTQQAIAAPSFRETLGSLQQPSTISA